MLFNAWQRIHLTIAWHELVIVETPELVIHRHKRGGPWKAVKVPPRRGVPHPMSEVPRNALKGVSHGEDTSKGYTLHQIRRAQQLVMNAIEAFQDGEVLA